MEVPTEEIKGLPPEGFKEIKAVFWQGLEPGDSINVIVERVEEVDENDMRYHVTDHKGDEFMLPTHTVLMSKLRDANVKKGDRVFIVFEGEKEHKIKGKQPIKQYRVYKRD